MVILTLIVRSPSLSQSTGDENTKPDSPKLMMQCGSDRCQDLAGMNLLCFAILAQPSSLTVPPQTLLLFHPPN